MPISKKFVLATSGPTIDGRNISPETLHQMAANYSPDVYTAVANLEHLLSYSPESLFSAHGKVIALSTQEVTLLGDKKTQLMGVVEASSAVVAMQKMGKKLFPSIEITPNFASKGIAYLTGLAFTDTPASLGTETMKFSAGKDHIYSFGSELALEWETEETQPSAGESLFSKVKSLLGQDKKDKESRFSDIHKAVTAIAESQKTTLETSEKYRAETEKLTQQFADFETKFTALAQSVEKLSGQPNGQPDRPTATGGTGATVTDC